MRLKIQLAGGIVGPVLFTLVWLIEGTVRPGYDGPGLGYPPVGFAWMARLAGNTLSTKVTPADSAESTTAGIR
jgi:hypothetical protein